VNPSPTLGRNEKVE